MYLIGMWNYLSFGPSCIRINQSAIRSRHQQEIAIQKHHKSIYDIVRSHLSEHYFIPMTTTILKQYSNQLLHDFNFSYFSPLSYHDEILTLNQATKGYNFYVGTEKEFDKKAQSFFQDTNAFIELKENPFNTIQDNDGIPVRPIENTIHAPTTNISNYLDEIIRPIFDKECQNTTIIDGVSLI
ncbi:unnamed protein product [Rotaria magnacalcarata]|uniref:Uncharacterized protein n=1 Tax=Rotaria magnacalcarata TaxID=392030 RepID=A0A8S2QRX4_9BILA|nr:unnamed protein product [Rotaria magnacalcarata]CAF4053523.1 unnamed protein product [Rotaria magnacalcarata]CAF4117350.1 unnamed protein product [Rotaria magnacalcarata]